MPTITTLSQGSRRAEIRQAPDQTWSLFFFEEDDRGAPGDWLLTNEEHDLPYQTAHTRAMHWVNGTYNQHLDVVILIGHALACDFGLMAELTDEWHDRLKACTDARELAEQKTAWEAERAEDLEAVRAASTLGCFTREDVLGLLYERLMPEVQVRATVWKPQDRELVPNECRILLGSPKGPEEKTAPGAVMISASRHGSSTASVFRVMEAAQGWISYPVVGADALALQALVSELAPFTPATNQNEV